MKFSNLQFKLVDIKCLKKINYTQTIALLCISSKRVVSFGAHFLGGTINLMCPSSRTLSAILIDKILYSICQFTSLVKLKFKSHFKSFSFHGLDITQAQSQMWNSISRWIVLVSPSFWASISLWIRNITFTFWYICHPTVHFSYMNKRMENATQYNW